MRADFRAWAHDCADKKRPGDFLRDAFVTKAESGFGGGKGLKRVLVGLTAFSAVFRERSDYSVLSQ